MVCCMFLPALKTNSSMLFRSSAQEHITGARSVCCCRLFAQVTVSCQCWVNARPTKILGTAGTQGQQSDAQKPKFGEPLLLYTELCLNSKLNICHLNICERCWSWLYHFPALEASTAHASQLDIGSTPGADRTSSHARWLKCMYRRHKLYIQMT